MSPCDHASTDPLRKRLAHFFTCFGPGIITGAADDDPSGIATYSQTGAQFGYGMLWTALYQIPLLMAVQEACARIGAVTGKGIAGVMRERYSRGVLYVVVGFVAIANTINIGADIGAVAEATRLIAPIPFMLIAVFAAVVIVLLEVFVSYEKYARILKWFALALLSYPITTFIIHVPWGEVLRATLIPHIQFDVAFLFIITGVFGTSISPYMFIWQASEEVEEERAHKLPLKNDRPMLPRAWMRNVRIDTATGMIVAELAQWFIIITTATVLFNHDGTIINSAADAAKAIEPLVQSFPNSGQIARTLFAIGIIGLGLLGIPVLAGATAYAISETFGWKEGLAKRFSEARGFYGVIIAATLIGLLMNFIGVNPFRALIYTAVLNGIAAVPMLYIIARMNTREDILGEHKGGLLSRTFVWVTFAVMALSGLALIYTVLV
jgi:NRAMP (natural resistance-associated macrophage protein)-like metal ion transporter